MELILLKVEDVGGSDVLNGFSEMEDYVVYQEVEMLSVRKINICENKCMFTSKNMSDCENCHPELG